jgi:multiple sugar transport system ATP-binding protein
MAKIELDRIEKVYPNGFKAVNDITLEVAEGEFMVLVGPSGCGKTTLLRMIAGLEKITSGTLKIGGEVVNDRTPKERDIAMVFQNYALYPHMSVQQNIAFSLKLRKVPKPEIRDKVQESAKVLGLTEWLERKPGQLSGGQRQRVAMGRAMVRQPKVFLMDEPLSNLDAKLRVQMRAEVSRIQRQLKVATVYVTHDQVEAMTMGDRVAVMHGGLLQQCDDPQTLYDQPVNLFVAAFIGSPSMNLYEAVLDPAGDGLRLGSQRIELPRAVHSVHPSLAAYSGRTVLIGLRPEHLTVATPAAAIDSTLEGEVDLVEALGNELQVHFTIDARRVLAEGAVDDDELTVRRGEGVARLDPRSRLAPGSRVRFEVDTERMHFFDAETGLAIRA